MVPADLIRNEADRRALREGMYFDEAEAERLVRFIETCCRPSSGRLAGHNWRLFDWQRDCCRLLWGWRRKDGTRRFRSGYISVGRQNGKSALCSWLSLALLLIDGEDSPSIASCALTREQASLVYDNIQFCVNNNTKLKKAVHVKPYQKRIEVPATNGKYFSISREAHSNLGTSLSGLIADELAFWPSSELLDALKPAMAARKQPLCLAITTASTLFTGPGYAQYQYARKIQDGTIDDPSFFAAVYEAPLEVDVLDESAWHSANPALKHGSLSIDELREAAEKAKHSKAEELAFRYYRLNNFTRGLTSFVSGPAWDACKGIVPDLTGQPIYLGLDLAHSRDLCAVTGVIPHQGDYYVIAHAWVPEEAARQKERNNEQRYESFAPHLKITRGNASDHNEIQRFIRELARKYKVIEIIGDPNTGGRQTLMALADVAKVYEFSQTARNYNNPIRSLEALIADRRIIHDGCDLMRWQMLNFHTELFNNWVQPQKSKDRTEKNDNVCALLMALARATLHETTYKPKVSRYESEGLFVL